MTMRPLTLLAATAFAAGLAAGCATGGGDMDASAEAEDRLAAYDATGETRSCLSLRTLDEIDPLDERRWLVTTDGGQVYLNEVSRGCSGAASDFTYLQYRTATGQLCLNQIVEVRDRNTDTVRGACGLGEFQELAPAD